MSEDDPVLVSVSGAVATVTLNRPKSFNAFNAPMRKQLLVAVRQLEADSSVRIVVLHGSGPGFCAGADLAEGVSQSVREQLENEYKPFLLEIADSAKIWIAAIHGSAAGIGGALAMTCDLAVMDEAATLYLAFAAIALVPDGGATWHLLRAMGHKRAMATIIEGRKITAGECVALGLVNVAAPVGTALDAARDWASRLALGAPLAQADAKKLIRASHGETLAEAISHEARLQEALFRTEDCRNGVAAFFAKQKPVFVGK
jgi:2-(1,2-epoxy-1,2-dihydrophenyl)acetyl-CoA isomerase